MIMQDDRLFYENLERRKSYMLRMFFSRLSSFVFIMFCVTSFLLIAGPAKAGLGESDQAAVVVEADDIVVGFWDLRDRESFFQVTNVTGGAITVHVQVWNASEEGFTDRCREFDFFDSYTGNDTHVYNISDLQTNNGSVINPPDLTDGHGYIYVGVSGASGCTGDKALIANHRIIDIPGGYEYRSAALGVSDDGDGVDTDTYGFNFNSANGTTFSDVVPVIGFPDVSGDFCRQVPDVSGIITNTVTLGEVRQSCAPLIVGCKPQPQGEAVGIDPVLVDLGINGALVNSRGYPSLCTDTTQDGWTLTQYIRAQFLQFPEESQCWASGGGKFCTGLVGINNGDGTGSMEAWTALDRRLDYFDLD
jgi:hypothetical protein